MTQLLNTDAPPRAVTAMPRVMRLLVAPVILVLSVTAVRLTLPHAISAGTWSAEFSTERAMRDVRRIARAPHPLGTSANHDVRDYIVAELRALNLEVDLQHTEVVSRFAGRPTAAIVENIIARRRGRAPMGKSLALMSHYDSHRQSPGAADAGSGVAAILEALRVLSLEPAPANDLLVVFTDGEEGGMLGAQAFVDQHALARDIGLILNFDARGTSGPVLLFETSEENAGLIRHLAAGAPAPIADSLFNTIYRLMSNATDMSVTRAAGLPGMNFGFAEGYRYYHSSGDVPARLAADTVEHAGSYAVSLARRFGSVPLPIEPDGDVGFFNLTSTTLVGYPRWLSVALLAAAAALFARLSWQGGLARWATLRQVGVGIAFSALFSLVVFIVVNRLHAALVPIVGAYRVPGVIAVLIVGYSCLVVFVYQAMLAWMRRGVGWTGIAVAVGVVAGAVVAFDVPRITAALTVLLVAGLLTCLRGRRAADSLHLGVLGFWLLLSALIVFVAPAAMHVVLFPCLALLLAEWSSGMLARRRPALSPFVSAVAAVACMWWLGYYAQALQLGVGSQAPGFGLLLVAWILLATVGTMRSIWLTIPAIETGLYGIAAVLLVGGAAIWPNVLDPDNDEPNDVLYARDLDEGRSFWVTGDATPDSWVRQFVSEQPQPRPLSWLFPTIRGTCYVAPAPDVPGAVPALEIVSDSRTPSERQMTLRLTPAAAGSELNLFFENPTQIRAAAINGQPATSQGRRFGWWRWTYYAMPSAGVTVTLTLDPDASFHARITEVLPAWPESLDGTMPRRPAGTVARPGTYSGGTLITRTLRDSGES